MAEILQPDQIDRAVEALRAGQLVAVPTETVYGLGADASQPKAVKQVFTAKGRPIGHPLIVHMADRSGLERFGVDVSPHAATLANAFWPGPLTIIVNRRMASIGAEPVADETVGGRSTVGLRVPDHPVALELLKRFGGGVAAPSANRFGGVSPTTAEHVIDDLGSSVAFVLDGGPSAIGVESTIVDLSNGQPTLLRPGGISTVELEAALGIPILDGCSGPSRAPGMMTSHYSPTANVELVTATELSERLRAVPGSGATQTAGVVGVVAPRTDIAVLVDHMWEMPSEAQGYAAQLYAVLREADKKGVETLLVVPPESGGLLNAVIDRLRKASADT